MTHHLIALAVVTTVILSGVASRPSNEETTPLAIEIDESAIDDLSDKEGKSLTYEVNPAEESNLRQILEKIKTVNNGLKSPTKRPQVKYQSEPQTGGGYVINKDILEKIQQIIASGKLNSSSVPQQYDDSNENLGGPRNSRDMSIGLPKLPIQANQDHMPIATHPYMGLRQFQGINNDQIPMAPVPYITNMPVMVMPLMTNIYNNDLNSISVDSSLAYSTRQSPSLPFNFQWPLAQYFPVLIRDPLVNFMSGGGWSNLIQYGQSADVCNRKQKSVEDTNIKEDLIGNDSENNLNDESDFFNIIPKSRQARALKKKTMSAKSTLENDIENLQKVKKFFSSKSTTPKPTKQSYVEEQQDTKTADLDDGDLRFTDFTLFGNRKPVAPSPGFFINRLKVRRGGVAIAGPGGVATAGRGGTAIVGPGGLAYTQPGGLAVAGPHARVVALSPESDLTSIVSRLQDQSATDGSVPRLLEAIPEGKVVAHGPVIYYHPNEQTYYRGWRNFQGDYGRWGSGFSRRSDEYQYNGSSLAKNPWKNDPFWLVLKPVAHAISSPRGVAVANPISHVVISRNDFGTVIHTPAASAVAGPGGIAHAQSDLYLYDYYSRSASVDYLPFYGGAKGQYLEIKKDNSGTVTSEKIVSEDKISSENFVKYNNENLIAKVLAANLQTLKTTTNNLLRLHTLGRKTGSLGNNEKKRFKNQLTALGEAASNTIKLIEEIGDDIDMLYKSNVTQKKYDFEDYIEEEGVGIEAPTEDEIPPLGGATIAEAKPVGLAVIGENGLAASRPVATAIASTGVALARPIATAVAGVDPAALGLNLQIRSK